MPNINISIEASLLQLVNIAAERCGMRQKVWVVETLKAAVKDEVLEPLGTRKEEAIEKPEVPAVNFGRCGVCGAKMMGWGVGKRCTVCGRTEQEEDDEVEEKVPEIPECPEACGPMTWNRFLNRWECKECQFVLKGKRA